MSYPLNVVGLAGSLRKHAYSKAVMAAIAGMLPRHAAFEQIDIGSVPHYDQDLEDTALPASVETARHIVGAAQAIVIVTPEFNHGLPGVLKNALDWLSRPAFNSCMLNKPVFFVTLGPGALGGVRAQYQLRETLSSMLCELIALPEVVVTHVGTKVEDGILNDAATLSFIASTLDRFLSAVEHDNARESGEQS